MDDYEWEYFSRKRYLYNMEEKYFDGKISYDQYMRILDENYDITDFEQAKEVEEWKAKKKQESEEKKRQEKIKSFRENQIRKKEEDKLLIYFFVIGLVIIFIIKMCKKL